MNEKITQLPAAAAVTSDDLFVVVDDPSGTPVTKKATAQKVIDLVNAPTLTIDNIALNVPVPYNAAHGLGATPRRVKFVLKMTAVAAGYSIGDEIDGATVMCNVTSLPPFTWGANATNVWLVSDNTFGSGDDQIIIKTGGGTYLPADNTNSVGKLYIWK